MNISKRLVIELSGEDIEKILTDYISGKMINSGYKLESSHHTKDSYFPDVIYTGIEENQKLETE